jgi:phosphoribosylpyrophosphate synthetase
MLPSNSGVVIADDGAIGRSHFFSHEADIPVVGRIIKERVNGSPTVKEIHQTNADGFNGKTIFLIDDMIATGGTLFKDAAKLKSMGAEKVVGVVTHVKGVKNADVSVRQNLGKTDGLDGLVITNSTPFYRQLMGIKGVRLVNVLGVMGRAAHVFMSENFQLDNAGVKGLEPISQNIFPINPTEVYKEILAKEYPMLVPEMK